MMNAVKSSFWSDIKIRDMFILLLFIFSVQFSFFPLNTARLVILFFLVSLCIFRKDPLVFPYKKATFGAFLLLLLYAVYAALITVYSGGGNVAVLLNIILILFQIALGSYILVAFFVHKNLDQFFFMLMIIFAFQGVLIFINFIFPAYRELLFQLIPPSGNITEDNFTSAFRTRGFMQSSGATVSSYLSVGFLFAVYFLTSFDLSKTDRRIALFSIPLILIGIVFTGRTGFVMVPIAFLAYYILLLVNGKLSLVSLLPIALIPLSAVVMYIVGKSLFLVFFPEGDELISLWEDWAFDQFLANFDSSSDKTSTLETLQSYLFIPEDDAHLIFGDPLSWGVIRTDLGYIRMLYATGIIGCVLFYGGFTQIFVRILQQSVNFSQQLLVVFILVWIFIVEYKEPMFSHFYFATTTMLMLFFSMGEDRRSGRIVE